MVSSIPPVIAGIAILQLASSSTLSELYGMFFQMEVLDQMALTVLLLSVVVMVVGVSHFLDGGNGNTQDLYNDDDDHDHTPPPQYPLKEISQPNMTDRQKFLCVFPSLRDGIANTMSVHHEMPGDAVDWIVEMMDYTCPGGKLNRGMTVLSVCRTFATADNNNNSSSKTLSPLEEARACILGWAIEFLQAFFLVADDLMDDSKTRRGAPCWYLLPKVGTIAVNDSFLLESFVFSFLKQHFRNEVYYTRLMELFLEVIQQTECGQLLDLTSQPKDTTIIDFSRFTMDRYKSIVKYKTAFYSFYLPVAIGMIVSGVTDNNSHKIAKRICVLMGEYFQVQDDYLDCYGAPEVIGKVGTDIQDNKCSWLVVQALQRATPTQKKILQDNYGQWDDAKVQTIKDLYNEMGLNTIFQTYEEQSYKDIQEELKKVTTMPHDVFLLFLDKIYKRSK